MWGSVPGTDVAIDWQDLDWDQVTIVASSVAPTRARPASSSSAWRTGPAPGPAGGRRHALTRPAPPQLMALGPNATARAAWVNY
eukprot:SAG22_NODE_14218_length_381_cov_0.914894_1_plen_84_part_00